LLSYVYADWESYAEEVDELHGEVNNFTASDILFVKTDMSEWHTYYYVPVGKGAISVAFVRPSVCCVQCE